MIVLVGIQTNKSYGYLQPQLDLGGAQTQSSGPHLFSYNQRLCLCLRKVILTSKRSLGENDNWLILVHMPISGPITVPREINGQAWSPVNEH